MLSRDEWFPGIISISSVGSRESSTKRKNHFILRLQKRKEKHQQAELEQKIKELEDSNINNPTENTQDTLRKYKFQLNELINKHTQFLIQRLRQENFQHSNKSGKYLANQIKQNKEKTTIAVITDTAGRSTNSPEEINQIFKIFTVNYILPKNTRLRKTSIHFSTISTYLNLVNTK